MQADAELARPRDDFGGIERSHDVAVAVHPLVDTDELYYCIGGRTGIGVRAASPEHRGTPFDQYRAGIDPCYQKLFGHDEAEVRPRHDHRGGETLSR